MPEGDRERAEKLELLKQMCLLIRMVHELEKLMRRGEWWRPWRGVEGWDAEGVDTTSLWQEDRWTEGVMCRWVC